MPSSEQTPLQNTDDDLSFGGSDTTEDGEALDHGSGEHGFPVVAPESTASTPETTDL